MKLASIVSVCLIVSTGMALQAHEAVTCEIALVTTAENPAEEVKAIIKKMIVLIEAGKTLELLEKYTDVPAEARVMVAERIEKEKLDQMKDFLGRAVRMTPKVTDDGKTVIFENDEFPRPMKFLKSGENWIMKDK